MKLLRGAAFAAAVLWAPALALAQAYPTKPIKIIVPYPAGGGVDFVARTVGLRLSEVFGQPVVVENRGGASGSIGAAAVASSAPDGYTLLLASPAEVVVGPVSGQKVPYDTARDFAPVTLVGETPLAIVAHPSVAAKDIGELIAAAKKDPAKYSYATPGGGSTMHFAGESLNALAGVSILHVPYKGAAPAVTDVLGGQVPLGIVGMPPVVQPTKAGKLKMLAVTSTKRSPTLPEVPAVAEIKGMEGYRFTNWMGLFAPGEDAPGGHRPPREGDREDRARAGREGEAPVAGRGGRREHDRGVRRVPEERVRRLRKDREGTEHPLRQLSRAIRTAGG
ncbi:MAG: tripartite tricarboxylate transporter substrate binding protein [Betaproteobacteria bacterium]|nr:tripartite tricarboxylate transporter substrate binding protein [Betaproteobacteria bacterium]